MKELLHRIHQNLGICTRGISAFFYSFYLRITRKLPYEVEMALKPEMKERYIRIESAYLLLCAIMTGSLILLLVFIDIQPVILFLIYAVFYLSAYFLRTLLERNLYR